MMNDTALAWLTLWKWIFILGGGAFCCLMVYAVITGAGDLRKLFRSLAGQQQGDRGGPEPGGGDEPPEDASSTPAG